MMNGGEQSKDHKIIRPVICCSGNKKKCLYACENANQCLESFYREIKFSIGREKSGIEPHFFCIHPVNCQWKPGLGPHARAPCLRRRFEGGKDGSKSKASILLPPAAISSHHVPCVPGTLPFLCPLTGLIKEGAADPTQLYRKGSRTRDNGAICAREGGTMMVASVYTCSTGKNVYEPSKNSLKFVFKDFC